MQHAKEYGLSAEKVGYDAAAVVKRSRAVSERLNDGVGFLMKKNKVTVIWGEAEIDAPGGHGGSAGRPNPSREARQVPRGSVGGVARCPAVIKRSPGVAPER